MRRVSILLEFFSHDAIIYERVCPRIQFYVKEEEEGKKKPILVQASERRDGF
jgi:hypothetical protein